MHGAITSYTNVHLPMQQLTQLLHHCYFNKVHFSIFVLAGGYSGVSRVSRVRVRFRVSIRFITDQHVFP